MSNKVETPYKHTFTSSAPDKILAAFVSWLNAYDAAEIGVTISVNGQMFTGLMVSGLRWTEESISACEKHEETEDAARKLKDYLLEVKETYLPREHQAEIEDIGYLHMVSARMVSGGAARGPASSWRFRIGEVDGFTLGVISTQ